MLQQFSLSWRCRGTVRRDGDDGSRTGAGSAEAPCAQIGDCGHVFPVGRPGARHCGAADCCRRERAGEDRPRPHHERCRLLRGRRHGVFSRRRHRGDHDAVQLGGADDGAARHRRSRRRRRHRVAGFYNSVGRGIATKIVADQSSMKPGYGYSSLMVRKDLVDSGRYKTLADLKGMKVAIGAPGTGTASALNETLKMGGLKYSDVEVVYLGFPEHLPAFLNKGIDAAISNEPTMTLEIEQGAAVRIIGNDVTYPDQQTAVVFYSERFIKNRHDVAERFMRAYIRGIRLYNDALKDGRLAGPAANQIIPVLTKYTSTKDEAMFRRIIPSAVNPNGEVNLAGLKHDLAFFRELGLIESKDVSADGVVDGSFVKAAVSQLGPYKAAAGP